MDQHKPTNEATIERLKASPFYQSCQDAFREATSLPLVLLHADEPRFNPCQASPNQNPFCRLLNTQHDACNQCKRTQDIILSKSRVHTFSHTCFAGLEETSVPLRLGEQTIGFLRTGQVFTGKPTSDQMQALDNVLTSNGFSQKEHDEVLSVYEATPFIDNKKYHSMITLLNIISLQLSEFLNRILIEDQVDEPEAIRKAKKIISERITDKITLKEVAREVHVSSYYLSKLFKQSTGLTFTEFINRQRIELAKRELKRTTATVTEIAYAVGFQSLSQFSRSFNKFTGQSPRQFRKHSRSVAASHS